MCESEIGIRYSCLLAQTHWFLRHIVLVSQTGVLCNDAIRNGLNCNDILLLLWEINWLEKVKTVDIYILCSYVKQILWLSKFPSSSDRIALEKLGKKVFLEYFIWSGGVFLHCKWKFYSKMRTWHGKFRTTTRAQIRRSSSEKYKGLKPWTMIIF